METSLMVNNYPEPKEEKTKEISGTITITYTFDNVEVPEEWSYGDIIEDIKENTSEYKENFEDIDIELR